MTRLARFVVPALLGACTSGVAVAVLYVANVNAAEDQNAAAALTTEQGIGKGIYDVRCSTCHGINGVGTKGFQLPATGPALKGNGFVRAATDEMLADVIRHGRTGAKRHYDDTFPNMPSFDASMIADIRPLIAYLKGDMQKD